MAGPARHGVLIYTNDATRLAVFYEKMFGMRITRTTSQMVCLETAGMHLVLHLPSAALPSERVNTIKLFMTVENHHNAHQLADELGGQSLKGEWSNPVFSISNIADCDGNIIQLRVFNDD